MNNQQAKISYDREARVLSIKVRDGKSADSDIHDNVVIDYDKNGRVVRVNFYDFSFATFQESKKELQTFSRDF